MVNFHKLNPNANLLSKKKKERKNSNTLAGGPAGHIKVKKQEWLNFLIQTFTFSTVRFGIEHHAHGICLHYM
jgi:hypothetical protein